MSRVGKKPIPVPSSVTVTIAGADVTVKGPKGELQRAVPEDIRVVQDGEELLVTRPSDRRQHRAFHGLTRALIQNTTIK